MQAADAMHRMYEELANRYARQGEARMRDHCLVLAADAALSAGHDDHAERLRKRLLLTNPHHLLRPYASMAEAMQSGDVQDYVADLRRKWPPEAVHKLLRQVPSKTEAPPVIVAAPVPEPEPTPEKQRGKKRAKATDAAAPPADALTLEEDDVPTSAASVVGYGIVMLLLLVAVVAAGGIAFFVLGTPFLE